MAAARRRKGGAIAVVDQYRPRTDRRFLHRVIDAARDHGNRPNLSVSLLLTDDRRIARIHQQHLNDKTPTDVISFDLDGEAEIVLNVQQARREARRAGHFIRAELALYLVHGILHLCGFDDTTARARRRMRSAERAVLAELGYTIARFD